MTVPSSPHAGPWEGVPPKDQFFVLVTGANGGIGLGIAERLVDWFLASRSPTSHLILITTTRSRQKSRQTTDVLRQYVRRAAASNPGLASRSGPGFDPASVLARVHLLSIQLDLCKLPTIHAAAELLARGPDGTLTDEENAAGQLPAPIPRLDSVIFNAGIGGWSGLNWLGMPGAVLRDGVTHQLTWPSFKLSYVGNLVDPLTGRALTAKQAAAEGRTRGELLGETFAANVFGHYVLAHALLPLLRRTRAQLSFDGLLRARVVWVGSVTPSPEDFHVSDLQAIKSKDSYESTKRLIDIMSLTAELPCVKPIVARYLCDDSAKATDKHDGDAAAKAVPPRMYVTHPGIVETTIFQLPAILVIFYRLALYIARWCGSPWHPVTPYNGAIAPAWVATEDEERLDSLRAERVKWGSAVGFWGDAAVKRTEVEGWGWDGRVASEVAAADDGQQPDAKGWLRDQYGRKKDAVDLRPEALHEFESLGAQCWEDMERLRLEWEDALGKSKPAANGKALAA